MSEPTPAPRPPLGIIRLIFAAIGVLIMVFAGGCTLLIGVPMIGGSGSDLAGMVPMLLLFGGVPFLVGLGLWFLAVKVGR
jgi:hypothetical protein